jgi:hypothetical protein
MAITTVAAVQKLLGPNYGVQPDSTAPDLQQFCDMAAAIVETRLVQAALNANPSITFSSVELELIERALACHFYTKLDPLYTSKNTGGASGSFVNTNTTEQERYKDMAINLDYSGMLKAILNRQVARASWLGKPPSQQIPIWQRD